jgi:hypothetical protein
VLSRLVRNLSFGGLLVTAALFGAAGPASAAEIANGNFETGTFLGWGVTSLTGTNRWTVADRKPVEEEFQLAFPAGVGDHVAVTEYNGADTDTLSQEVALPAASNITLSLYLFYESAVPLVVPSPNTLFVSAKPEGTAVPANQQVRIDVLKPNAPLESVSPNDILATPYASQTGGPQKLGPQLVTADLSAFAGQSVRLRIAAAAEDGPLEAGVADVSLASTPIPPPAVEPILTPLTALIPGKLALNRAGGVGALTVPLPGPGRLTVSDARRQIAIASRRSVAKSKQILIRTTSIEVGGAQTVRIPIRPTAVARKRLSKSGELPFRLQLTFTPTTGAVSTTGYKGTLLKRLKPVRR